MPDQHEASPPRPATPPTSTPNRTAGRARRSPSRRIARPARGGSVTPGSTRCNRRRPSEPHSRVPRPVSVRPYLRPHRVLLFFQKRRQLLIRHPRRPELFFKTPADLRQPPPPPERTANNLRRHIRDIRP